jgi:prophage regulatory protein
VFNNVLKGANMTTTILRLPSVCQANGNSRSTLYQKVKDGLYPPPVSIGTRAVGWPAAEVDMINRAYIAGLSEDDIRKLVASLVLSRKAALGESLK